MNMKEFYNSIDWPLLHEQKLTLLKISLDFDNKKRDDLNGILNLIDALQDDAEEMGIWKFPE